mmetsp:Transcript_24172/g.39407  ORF Transcript_24172/g.39407 Transcript_24172/m.39407 type:complete len:314 (+) Transcript_24172:30-971(+)
MPLGRLKKYVNEKGFGFITPDDGGKDIFAHTQQFAGDGDSLRGGERVIFESEWDEAKQKNRATTWSLDASAATILKSGTVKVYFPDKGFGFIAPDEGGDDIFAHSRQFIGDNADGCKEGDRVKFDAAWDEQRAKMKAAIWRMDNDGLAGAVGALNFACQPGLAQGCYGPMATNLGCDPRFSPYGCTGCMGCGCGMPGMGCTPGMTPGAACGCAGAPQLPPGWEQITDPGTGQTYYCNRSTGESSWTPPAAAPMAMGAPATGATGAPMLALAPTPMGAAGVISLPQGWEEAKDPASGKAYYFNRSTGETRWDPP